MKRRKKLLTPWVAKTTPGYESKAEFFAREAREAQERIDEPLRRVQNQMNAALRENAANVAQFFSRPIEKLLNSSTSSAPIDYGLGSFPGSAEDQTDDERRFVLSQFGEASQAQGFDLSEQGWTRFLRYAKLQSHLQKFAITPEFLHACLIRLSELKCFASSELVKGEIPKRQSQPQSQPQETNQEKRRRIEAALEEIPDSREGRNAAMQIIGKMFSYDVEVMYRAWAEQMDKDWHVDVVVPKITAFAGRYFLEHGLNPLTARNYDLLRRVLSKQGLLGPLDYRTKEEKLADALEESNLDSRDVRQALARHTREILEAGPGRKGGITL